MRHYIFLFLLTLLFSGCDSDLFNTEEVAKLKQENSKLQQELTQKQKAQQLSLERERLSSQTELEKEKLKSQTELEKLRLQKQHEKELERIRQQTLLQQQKQQEQLYIYIFILLGILLLGALFFLYLYLKRKREDKLQAYNDNLKKYFLLKEHEMKLKMADKILETLKESNLSKEDQKKLIAVLGNSDMQNTQKGDDDAYLIESK